jgi:hypothetical protein
MALLHPLLRVYGSRKALFKLLQWSIDTEVCAVLYTLKFTKAARGLDNIYLSIDLSLYLPFYLSIYLSIYLFIYIYIYI